ncbi:6-N-hydroxylaminopurine resistance protein [Planctomycetes bacterium CA13]|uniref:6-N-hydroxylaminopurine resistance protein n=1 Tax=Novipirellula herctigrandis TaxID=2527986 RepID=A0A5C5Z4G3_9BACT|nr:6-N-hydroxylaminopurine resistance protein [Planctomycetes bacterium CA13]
MIRVAGVQIGKLVSEGDSNSTDTLSRHWTTGFYKMPISDRVKMTAMGIAGDHVANTKNHGGIDKAVLCYAAVHYDAWAAEHPELAIGFGGFAENLTMAEMDEQTVCLGDRYRIGSCEIEVSQPRQPCWKIARRWGVKSLVKETTQTGRTGWYVRVVVEGELQVGDEVTVLERPCPTWTVARANDVMFGRRSDRAEVIELMSVPLLAEAWKKDLA